MGTRMFMSNPRSSKKNVDDRVNHIAVTSRKHFLSSKSKCRRVLEKIIAPQLVNNILAFYGTRSFITVFTKDRK